METFIRKIFFDNFLRKFLSLLAALIIWTVVSESITTTKVFHRVPVRVVNLPQDKTVRGIMPDGFLDRRLTVSLTGSKAVLDQIGQHDLEVLVDATDKKGDWIVKVSKKNLVCVNPDIDLLGAVSNIVHSELIVRMCRFVTEKIPVHISTPVGSPPPGYQFLDVWPKTLYHIISGPEDDLRPLREEGVQLEFDLSSIAKEDLDSLKENEPAKGEIGYFVPDVWKKVRIPYLNNFSQALYCPDFSEVRLDFLFEELLPVDSKVPVRLFFPPNEQHVLSILRGGLVEENETGLFLRGPLYASNVSPLFLDTVKGHLQLLILPTNKENSHFCWELQFVAERHLEDRYVAKALSREVPADKNGRFSRSQQEEYHRSRFREYIRQFRLWKAQNEPLSLKIEMTKEGLLIDEVDNRGEKIPSVVADDGD